jgi:hypothetical protein
LERPGPEHQFRADQFCQRALQSSGRLSGDIAEHFMTELTTENSADLCQLTPAVKPIETRHQRGLQRVRNRQSGARGIECGGLQHRLCQLLDKQRDAVGPGNNLVQQR